MKLCPACLTEKPLSEFYVRTVRGKQYPFSYCKVCEVKRSVRNVSRERQKKERRAYFVCMDSRRADAQRGMQTDIDVDFVENLLVPGCSYCGRSDIKAKIGLDRIDNSIGHLKSNVVAACYDCNVTRRHMPYSAWLLLAEGMRKAREQGLLEGWSARQN